MDPNRCSLFTIRVEDAAGSYDALSNTWGTDSPSCRIFIDNKPLLIRRNLWDFLHSIRSPDDSIDPWADAFCIDQSDTTEKNHQVQKMSVIYLSSRRTRIWLGAGSSHLYDLDIPDWDVQGLERPSFMPDGLSAILNLDYWTRLWIVQEVILSSAVIVHYDKLQFTWQHFFNVCRKANNLLTESHSLQLSRSTIMRFHIERTEKATNRRRTFTRLLHSYGHCNCSGVRDRVYGLLGLLDDKDFVSPIVVDYALEPFGALCSGSSCSQTSNGRQSRERAL